LGLLIACWVSAELGRVLTAFVSSRPDTDVTIQLGSAVS
jgi:hypothetical protein